MSNRNTQEAKRAARERLREERDKQAKREKLRRQLIVGATAVGVLGVAGLVGLAISNSGGGGDGDATDWEAVALQLEEADDDYDIPENAAGDDGLTVLIGDEGAENTVTFYEEPRCGGCAGFEQRLGETIQEGVDGGDFQAEYVFGTFFDEHPQSEGTGSRNAISALGAALNVSPEAFSGFLHAMYSEDFHTSTNRSGDFGDDSRMIEIAKTVDALDDDADFAKFEDAFNDSTFAPWAVKMSEKFATTPDVESTPTMKVNGEVVPTPETPEDFRSLVAN